jgi:hypothetical protein
MSVEENFEVLRRCLAAFESDPEVWLETLDPAIRWYPEEEREYAEGAGSGIEIESRIYHHWKIRDGRVAYIYETTDRAEALEAARLRSRR